MYINIYIYIYIHIIYIYIISADPISNGVTRRVVWLMTSFPSCCPPHGHPQSIGHRTHVGLDPPKDLQKNVVFQRLLKYPKNPKPCTQLHWKCVQKYLQMKPRSKSFTYLWPDFVRPYSVFFTFSCFYVTQTHQQIATSLYLAKCLQISLQIRKLSHFLSFLASLLVPISSPLLGSMLTEIPFWPTLAIKVPTKRPVTSPMLKKAKKTLHNYPKVIKSHPKVIERGRRHGRSH